MRKTDIAVLLLSLVALGLSATAQSRQISSSTKVEASNPLDGAWNLVSLKEPDATGKLHQANCSGLFVFTSDGKASVQVLYANADKGSTYTQGGYEASYGSYHLDNASTFTFHIDGAIVRTLIGKDLRRSFKISGNRLTVMSTNPGEHWEVVWERN